MTGPSAPLLREAAAPLLLCGGLAAGLATVDIWAAATLTSGQAPSLSLRLFVTFLRGGPTAVLPPASSATGFAVALAVLIILEATSAVGLVAWLGCSHRTGDPRRSLLRRHELDDLAGRRAAVRAQRLRPSLDPDAPEVQRGIRLLRIDGHDVWMSWEDVALIVMGPRANKTSVLAVLAVLSAPGLAIATSNKADLWALTSGLRAEAGPVWTFNPQGIAHVPQRWWWDPLRAIRDAPEAHRYEAASRLAAHSICHDGKSAGSARHCTP